ncbi:MAG: thioredoxin fold domain-containing protein, partial [Gammaproteobacteria bacterium]|nr:thioredoxin fold domain-containing protein [Gammaproteobacteria bacterium]
KATTVYCSDDRNTALTRAKNNEQLAPLQCDSSTKVKSQYDTGRQVGLNGTPAIVTSSGELIAGYLPAKSLLTRLDRSANLAK